MAVLISIAERSGDFGVDNQDACRDPLLGDHGAGTHGPSPTQSGGGWLKFGTQPKLAGVWRRAKRCAYLTWLFGLLLTGPGVSHAEVVSYEYPLKAIFLLNFAHFTDWPTNALADPQAPFVIGVIGKDPFGGALDDTVRDENWNNHPIVIQRYHQLADLQACQILFISSSEMRRLPKILSILKGKPVLTVADIDDPVSSGVSIQLRTVSNKIRFKINTDALKTANLSVSSKLLRLAEIAPPPTK